METVLATLKLTNQRLAHIFKISRSPLRFLAQDTGSGLILKREVSSAYRFMSVCMLFMMSFVYTKKRSGPNMEPCGTPALTEVQVEEKPLKTTFWQRSEI